MPAYDLEEVARALGLKSKHAARKRINAIRDLLEKRGFLTYLPMKGNALAVKPEGLLLLLRAQELTGGAKTISEAAEALRIDLGEKEPPPDVHELRAFKGEVKLEMVELRHRIENLEKKVERKRWWERMLMLPRGKEE